MRLPREHQLIGLRTGSAAQNLRTMHQVFYRLALGMELCLPLLASAQTPSNDPSHANAAAAPLRYRSAFSDYKPWQDIKQGDWRAVNDTVRDAGQGGGHAGHGMDAPGARSAASAPEGKAAAPDGKASAPAAMPDHGGHQMQGGKR